MKIKNIFNDIIFKLNVLFCYHRIKWIVENIKSENNVLITIGFEQCDKCGFSKIEFIYGNK